MREYAKNSVKQALLGYRRGHNTHPIKRVFSAFLGITILTTTFITALIPLTEIPIYAAGTGKILQLGTGPLENGSTVYYGSKTDAIGWNIIGFKGDGVASGSENATLISSGVLGTTQFSASEGRYKDSLLHTEINNILSNRFTDNEDTVMPDRTLPGKENREEAYAYPSADSNYIWGTDLSGQKLWPLSTEEAITLYGLLPAIAGIGSHWWLRSPGNENLKAAYVPGDGWPFRTGENVDKTYGVRPAFNINLSSIILTSAAEGGKDPGTKGAGTLNEVASYTGTAWKLTISDTTRSSFTASAGTGATVSMPEGYTSWTVPVTYSNAQAGENEHVSAILTDSSGVALYYGYIATNSTGDTKNVTIPTGLAKGTYTLNVFNEQCNGDKKTDLSSPIRTIGLTVTEAQQVATPTFTPAEGTYIEAQNVTISCTTTGATIHYTTDGTDPTSSSSAYSSPITVSETTTIKAIAVKDGMTDSQVAEATYTIEEPPTEYRTVTFDPNANDARGKMDPQKIEKGKTEKLNENRFTREGFTFDSWNTKADGSGEKYADKSSITPQGDMTLYAQWKAIEPKPQPEPEPVSIKNATVVLKSSKIGYNGKNRTPVVKTIKGLKLKEGTDYSVSVQNSKGKAVKTYKALGKYTLVIKGKGNYTGSTKVGYEIVKGTNPLNVTAVKEKYNVPFSKIEKKDQTINKNKLFKFRKKGAGSITYSVSSAKKDKKSFKKFFSVSSKGKLTIKKGLKKGSYTVKVNVKAKGDKNYKSATKTVKFTVKVK